LFTHESPYDYVSPDGRYKLTFPATPFAFGTSLIPLKPIDDGDSVSATANGVVFSLATIDGDPTNKDSLLDHPPRSLLSPALRESGSTEIAGNTATTCKAAAGNSWRAAYFTDADRLYVFQEIGVPTEVSTTFDEFTSTFELQG